MQPRELLGTPTVRPRFVIFSSYGNDSVALIQWARNAGLKDVAVVYSDTKWSAKSWEARVNTLEWWVAKMGNGFWCDRTTSQGFVSLAHEKKAFPTQQFQWCSYILKIEPGQRWLAENDPDKRAVCLVGVRREESQARAKFPEQIASSGNHGGRTMLAPLANLTEAERDSLLEQAGVTPLPHRSMECSPCVNSNRADIRALDEDALSTVEALEADMTEKFGLTKNGKRRTFFRPHRHMGAVGIREVKRWADSKRGGFEPEPEADNYTCNNGFCVN